MRLFEISERLEHLLNLSVDENGEINEAALEELTALEEARDAKALAVASYIVGQEAEADAIEATAKRLRERAAVHRRHAARLRQYVESCVPAGEKISDDRVSISWRKSQAVRVVDEAAIPDEHWRYTREVDKAAIRDALKAGEAVPGCELEHRTALVIK